MRIPVSAVVACTVFVVAAVALLSWAFLWPLPETFDPPADDRNDEETLEQLRAVAQLWKFAPNDVLEAQRLRELLRCRGGVAVFHGELLAQCWSRDEALELLEASERACREIEAPECWALTFQLFDDRDCPEPEVYIRDTSGDEVWIREPDVELSIYRTQEAEDELAFQRCQDWLEEDPEGRGEICRALRVLAVGLRQ